MLVEFSVENFRVFREEQAFSMVPAPSSIRNKPEELISTGFVRLPYLHHQATVYGANGAGKTSLVKAFQFMTRFVRDSHNSSALGPIETVPFIYNDLSRQRPSKFRVVFLSDDTMYEYGFTVSCQKVIEEYLLARPQPPGKTRQLFVREFVQEENEYKWIINSKYLKGDLKSVRQFTRPNALLLSTAINLNNDSLKKVFQWIVSKPVFISEGDKYLKNYTARLFYNRKWKLKLINFFQTMDTRIVDIRVRSSVSKNETLYNQSFGNYENNASDSIDGEIEFNISFVRHNNSGHRVLLPLDQESLGTQLLFQIAGRLLKSIEKGRVILIDEMNTNLHPLINREIISMVDGSILSRRNPQLIFTTHDVTASDHENISRDQTWLIHKKSDLSSDLYAFSDFDVPKENLFQRGYLFGRYGGVPRIVRREL